MSYQNIKSSENQTRRLETQITGQRRSGPIFSDQQSRFRPIETNNFPKFNYTTTGRYEGEMVGFAIEGQVLTEEEMQEVGLVNYIQFDYCGLGLYLNQTGPPDNRINQIWIGAGQIAQEIPSGFDPIKGKFIASSGSGYVWALIVINETSGSIVSVDVQNGGSIPEDTDTNFYYGLGYYSFSGNKPQFTNYGCGSVSVAVCRNWFAAEPPKYSVFFDRG
jgi:hypothetical protein